MAMFSPLDRQLLLFTVSSVEYKPDRCNCSSYHKVELLAKTPLLEYWSLLMASWFHNASDTMGFMSKVKPLEFSLA